MSGVQGVIRARQRPYTLKEIKTTIVNGRARKTVGKTRTIKAHIQPMNSQELQNMPEGQRHLSWYNIWSVNDVIDHGDFIEFLGRDFEIQQVKRYELITGGFWRGSFVFTVDRRDGQ